MYQRILALTYVDDLLESLKRSFVDGHYDKSDPGRASYAGFGDELSRLTKKAEATAAARKAPKGAPKAFDAAKKAAKRNDASGKARIADADDAESAADATSKGGGAGDGGDGGDAAARAKQAAAATAAFDISKLKKKGGKGSRDSSRENSGADLKSMGQVDGGRTGWTPSRRTPSNPRSPRRSACGPARAGAGARRARSSISPRGERAAEGRGSRASGHIEAVEDRRRRRRRGVLGRR